jgi:hypothetical protein
LQLDRTGASSDELIDLVAAVKADLALGGILASARQALKVHFSRPLSARHLVFPKHLSDLGGDVLVSIHTEAKARYMLHKMPSARIKIRMCLGGARSYLVAIAVRHDAPDLLRWVNTFLQVRLIDMTADELLKFGEQEKLCQNADLNLKKQIVVGLSIS